MTALDAVAARFDIVAPGRHHFIRTVTENRARISPHMVSVGVPMRFCRGGSYFSAATGEVNEQEVVAVGGCRLRCWTDVGLALSTTETLVPLPMALASDKG